ncbi:MAG: MATE family efflux transporter, partial [Oscillospiraceae bacterium]|nr:MATE family efflux transporter [Oscillospiraceae bacterium]
VALTESYLSTVAVSIPLTFVTATLGAAYTAYGNSRTPFICNAVGTCVNMALDPLLIFTFGLGVLGAAYATAIAQAIACVMIAYAFARGKRRPFESPKLLAAPRPDEIKWIFKKALPVCAESFLFTFLVMATSRREAFFGADAMAISRVGSQIESLTWLVGGAFGSALISFVGQNYGARKWSRIHATRRTATAVLVSYGAFVALLLAVPGKYIFGIFLPDAALIERSALYLRILAICQIPMCMEGVASNMFRGIGKTVQPAIVSTACNIARVPLAYALSAHTLGLGLPGVWIAISITASIKGIWSYVWYMVDEAKRKAKENVDQGDGSVDLLK